MKNMMYKLLSALTICALALGCLAAGLAAEATEDAAIPENLGESDILGVWQLTSMIIDGAKLSPAMIGIDMRYEFREDHTARGTFAGMLGDSGQAEETWTLDAERAMILVSGEPFLKVRCEDGTLFMLMDEEVSAEATGALVFTRMEEEP